VHAVGSAQSVKISFASTKWERVQTSGWLWYNSADFSSTMWVYLG